MAHLSTEVMIAVHAHFRMTWNIMHMPAEIVYAAYKIFMTCYVNKYSLSSSLRRGGIQMS